MYSPTVLQLPLTNSSPSTSVRFSSTQTPAAKASSLLDALPGNSLVSKTGIVTLTAATAAAGISSELFVLNEEVVILGSFVVFLGYVSSLIRQPYAEWADGQIEVSPSPLPVELQSRLLSWQQPAGRFGRGRVLWVELSRADTVLYLSMLRTSRRSRPSSTPLARATPTPSRAASTTLASSRMSRRSPRPSSTCPRCVLSPLYPTISLTNAIFTTQQTAQLEHETFALKQQATLTAEVKAVLDSWVRHEAQVREAEQRELVQTVLANVQKQLGDKKLQRDILVAGVAEIESEFERCVFWLGDGRWEGGGWAGSEERKDGGRRLSGSLSRRRKCDGRCYRRNPASARFQLNR